MISQWSTKGGTKWKRHYMTGNFGIAMSFRVLLLVPLVSKVIYKWQIISDTLVHRLKITMQEIV